MTANNGDSATILKLTPSLHERIWGGSRIGVIKNNSCQTSFPNKIGESWEVSIRPEGPSYYKDIPLFQLANERQVPYLIKLLHSTEYLSVQVHPDDKYAGEHENSKGKTECWLILECDSGSGIYLGVKPGVAPEKFFEVAQNSGDLTAYLNYYPVTRGDFFFVPAGTVHAIGKNILLVEVQQSAGLTYRIWDWNRVDSCGKARELHIEKAKQVVEFAPLKNNDAYFSRKKMVLDQKELKLISHPDFNLMTLAFAAGEKRTLHVGKDDRYACIFSTQGVYEICVGDEKEILNSFESIILTRMCQVQITAKEKGNLLITQ